MRYYPDSKPDEPSKEIRYVITAAFRSGAQSLDLKAYLKWDVHHALTELQSEPLGWEVFQWLIKIGAIQVHQARCADQITHLQNIAYMAQAKYHYAIQAHLQAEMQRLMPRFDLEGAIPLVPILRALRIDKHNARDFTMNFNGEIGPMFARMFAAAVTLLDAPPASSLPDSTPP